MAAAGERLDPGCRLGLATRGDGRLSEADVERALDRGIRFLNWPGTPDALSRTIARLGSRRREVRVCVQFEARAASEAETELANILRELNTEHVDVLTFYYVEEAPEWDRIAGPGGALDYCRQAQRAGRVRWLGLTSHQRSLAAAIAGSGLIDLLMIRYNAAHRGAEQDIFPVTEALAMPVITYTGLRWGALLRSTPDDPPGYRVPRAPDWYRFVLQHPAVTVALMAPENRDELEENLTLLEPGRQLSVEEYSQLAAHGQRVRRHAGRFP
jgi:predicted aldo/keto reductase-like oxidoreductase